MPHQATGYGLSNTDKALKLFQQKLIPEGATWSNKFFLIFLLTEPFLKYRVYVKIKNFK